MKEVMIQFTFQKENNAVIQAGPLMPLTLLKASAVVPCLLEEAYKGNQKSLFFFYSPVMCYAKANTLIVFLHNLKGADRRSDLYPKL